MKIKIKKIEQPIITHNWNSLWVYHPCLVQYKNNFYIVYTGKRIKKGIAHQIGIAKSHDLIHWEKYKKNPILKEGERNLWDSDFVAHGYIFNNGKIFYMLYDGSKKGDWLEEIGIAKSRDLIHWEKYQKNPIFKIGSEGWEKRHVSRACLSHINGLNYLFYAGHDGARERIGIAKGKTIFALQRFLQETVLDVGKRGDWDEKSVSDPRIIRHKNTYLMFYSGIDRWGVERTGAAISRNLTLWKKYAGNPILDVSENSWDKISATRVDIKIINGTYYLFYSGRKNYFYDIGMAKLEIT